MILADIAMSDARFFLKSEYGPLSVDWPVVAFSHASFETQIRREYRTGRDFVVYLGTSGDETPERDRGCLLSVAEIDTTRIFNTYDYLSESARQWAEKEYPGRWLRSFRVVRGFDLPTRPKAAQLLAQTDRQMWHVPFREVKGQDRLALLEVEVAPLENLDILHRIGRPLDHTDLLRPENRTLSQEAIRLADLVFNRVNLSGQLVQHRAPERSAPTDLQLQILNLLMRNPLICSLCGGQMQVPATNKLLKISGDRKDSGLGDYGPNNYQLVHFACNLAKNNASDSEFAEWLEMVRAVTEQKGELINA